jgi:hypothetical protein
MKNCYSQNFSPIKIWIFAPITLEILGTFQVFWSIRLPTKFYYLFDFIQALHLIKILDSGDKMSSIQTIKLVHGRDKSTTCEIFLVKKTLFKWQFSNLFNSLINIFIVWGYCYVLEGFWRGDALPQSEICHGRKQGCERWHSNVLPKLWPLEIWSSAWLCQDFFGLESPSSTPSGWRNRRCQSKDFDSPEGYTILEFF